MAEDQRDRSVAGDEFDLRDAALAVERVDQRGQFGDALAKRRHDRVAMAQLGHETRIQLAKTDHRAAFLLDEPHRETTLAPITPGGVDQRLQHATRLRHGRARQVFQQHVLLGGDLLVLVEVLQHAAGADAEVRAARLHPVRRSLEHFDRLAFIEVAIAAGLLDADRSPGKAPVTNTALPSSRPTPRPSCSRSVMSSSNSRLILVRERATGHLQS